MHINQVECIQLLLRYQQLKAAIHEHTYTDEQAILLRLDAFAGYSLLW